MNDMTTDHELGPVDYLVVEFPAGHQSFSGEMVQELAALVQAGTIRIFDLLIVHKDVDGTIDAFELEDLDDGEGLEGLDVVGAEIAELLAHDDVAHLAAALEPGSVAGVVVWENTWATPFASAARRAGGQLVASGRIPLAAIAASMEAELEELDDLEMEGV